MTNTRGTAAGSGVLPAPVRGRWPSYRARWRASVLALVIGVPACRGEGSRTPDVRYEPTHPKVVEAMLDLADVRSDDVVYDLGCGDGRIVIRAVKERGARGVCIDIDPVRIAESRRNAERAGVVDRITFHTQDLFESDLSRATVVMLFLFPDVNLRLRPKLLRELDPGDRVVSHWHDMGSWAADKTIDLDVENRRRQVFLWTIQGSNRP